MKASIPKFVFAVCGAQEHIDTLNYVLPFLRHFSKDEIIVITDHSRNETEFKHYLVVNVETPKDFDNHQAAIYLKTGFPKFLDMHPRILYCYLDTDIIALTKEVDLIFQNYNSPITFC